MYTRKSQHEKLEVFLMVYLKQEHFLPCLNLTAKWRKKYYNQKTEQQLHKITKSQNI